MRFKAALTEALAVTLGLSGIAGLWVSLGYWRTDGQNLAQLGLTLEAVLALYLAAGVLTGVIYAATRAWRFSWWGRVASGVLVGCGVGGIFAIVLPLESDLPGRVIIAALYGMFVGGLWGAVWMRRPKSSTEEERSARRAA